MLTKTGNRTSTTSSSAPPAGRPKAGTTPDQARKTLTDEEQFRLIQMRAYLLWEKAGKPAGDAAQNQFWFEAEKQVCLTAPSR